MNKLTSDSKLPLRIAINRVGEPTLAEYAASRRQLNSPASAVEFWHTIIAAEETYEPAKEHLVCILLNTRIFPVAYNVVAIGSLTECICHPREILRPCVLAGAYGFVVGHNHPSGDPSPSTADQRITTRIREAAEILQIRFFDHFIVGEAGENSPGYFSFKENGTL